MKKVTFEKLPQVKTYTLKYGVSRGQDTYGYNIVTLSNNSTGKKYRTMGGGYDMLGTVMAELLEEEFGSELLELKKELTGFYGVDYRDGKVYVQGAVGYNLMEQILSDYLGYEVTWIYKLDREGRPDYKIGLTLNKKNIVGKTLYTKEKLSEKYMDKVFNLSKLSEKSEVYISEIRSLDSNLMQHYKSLKETSDKTHVALRGHSGKYYLVKV